MSFANALNILQPTLPYYLALAKYGLLRINQHSFEFDPNPKAPALAIEMAKTVFLMGASSCTESYVMSRTLAEGPKVFSFSDALTCEALENFDLSVATTDYLQPFPSVVIELPGNYTKEWVVPFEAGTHAPDFIIVRHEPEAKCVLMRAYHRRAGRVLHSRSRREWRRAPHPISFGDSANETPCPRHRRASGNTARSATGREPR